MVFFSSSFLPQFFSKRGEGLTDNFVYQVGAGGIFLVNSPCECTCNKFEFSRKGPGDILTKNSLSIIERKILCEYILRHDPPPPKPEILTCSLYLVELSELDFHGKETNSNCFPSVLVFRCIDLNNN